MACRVDGDAEYLSSAETLCKHYVKHAECVTDAKLAAAAERDISQAGAADGSGGVPNLAREALPDQATDDQDDLLPPEIVAALAQRSR